MNSPEKIWVLPYEGSPDTGRFFPSKLAGTTEYVRADIAALNPDAIWNEAIEAAAGVCAAKLGTFFGPETFIRALKRQQGGGNSLPLGTRVRKTRGSSWQGRIVGTYSTSLTPAVLYYLAYGIDI